ncbi:hypothetical protein [Sphingomonas sp. T9W2]|uniref:hypothetical protein n=1 Tax=Sphingomonas sp. T9W2 TaxID=3143183 RepID=UPI0031F49B5D
MRTHSEIVTAAGPARLAELRGVSLHTARSWAQRNSIPAEHWFDISREGIASVEELAVAVATSPRRRGAEA